MNDVFNLSFNYKEKQYELESVFVRVGYVHQFHVQLEGQTVIIEFDEERDYRVIGTGAQERNIDQGLMKALVEKISLLH